MGLLQSAYNVVRPHLPKNNLASWAGVPARTNAPLDLEDSYPNYKRGLIESIHDYVDAGDRIALVGGGRGVSTVHCLRAGAGQVVVYEAAANMLSTARETVEMSRRSDRVDFRHALVGEAIDVYGDLDGADVVHPSEIASADVLVMDCEGAERSILAHLEEWPSTVIVETHPERGVGTETVFDLLDTAGYDVDERQFEPDQEVPSKRVLVGVNNP